MPKRARVGLTAILACAGISSWVGCQDPTGPRTRDPIEGAASPPRTGGVIQVRTMTRGGAIDPDGYILEVDGNVGPRIGTHATMTVESLEAGEHTLELTDLATQCMVDGSNPRVVTLVAGAAETEFDVKCAGTLSVASEEERIARPGEPLSEPLAVQVTGETGLGLPNIEVRWRVSEGAATLHDAFSPSGDGALHSASTMTDTDGVAVVPLMPLGFEVIEVNATVWGADGSPAIFHVDATDPGATLAIASGSDQPATAGQPLDEPLVARVTDGRGDPVAHVQVVWRIESGDGDLGRDALSGRLLADTTWTTADGLTQASPTPTWFGPVEVSASAVGTEGAPLAFTIDASDPGAALTVIAGDAQDGKAGEPLEAPLVVRATDGRGNPASNVRLSWNAEAGVGGFGESPRDTLSSYTDDQGLAAVSFSPLSLGELRMDARLDGTDVTASFTTDVDVLLIHYASAWLVGFVFYDVAGGAVPVGTTVEWVNDASRARIMSTSRPVDGAAFDSGALLQGERFEFVPAAVGSWEYTDSIRGVTGTLTVY